MKVINKLKLLANRDRVRIRVYVRHLLNTMGWSVLFYWIPVYRLKLKSELYAAKIAECQDSQQQSQLYITYLNTLQHDFKFGKFNAVKIKRCLDAHLKSHRVVLILPASEHSETEGCPCPI